jgi:hypothetical protein
MSNDDTPKYDFQRFLKDNLPILTIIGVFAAVSKFFLDTKSPNVVLLSQFSVILIIFLLIIFVLITLIHLLKRFKNSINAGGPVFVRSSINDIIIALFGLFIVGIVITMIQILKDTYSIDIHLILLSIGVFLGLLISIYAGLYILFKITNFRILCVLFFLYMIIFGVIEYFFDISHNLLPNFQPLSPLAPLYGFLVINTIIFPIIIIKLIYHGLIKDILSKCKQSLKLICLDIQFRFNQFRQKFFPPL